MHVNITDDDLAFILRIGLGKLMPAQEVHLPNNPDGGNIFLRADEMGDGIQIFWDEEANTEKPDIRRDICSYAPRYMGKVKPKCGCRVCLHKWMAKQRESKV